MSRSEELSGANFSDAYRRHVWGANMRRYEYMRDALKDSPDLFAHLDACKLVKHAFGLRTAANKGQHLGKKAVLIYVYAQPTSWPDGKPISPDDVEAHDQEVKRFSAAVKGDEVQFLALTYGKLLASWLKSLILGVRTHAAAVAERFKPFRPA